MTSRAEVVATARTWENVKFQPLGYNRHGCDCGGLFIGIGLELGLEGFSRWTGSSFDQAAPFPPNPEHLLAACDAFGDRIDPRQVRPADALILRFERDPIHITLVSALDPVYIIHAMSMRGCVKHHRLPQPWKQRIVRAYRLRGLTD